MTSEQKIKLLATVGLPIICLVFYITASFHFNYTPDDTYIYLQFARNFVNGYGMSFNAGEPTYGFTSPLWLMVISLGGKMGIDYFIAAKVLDVFLATISLVVFFMLAFEMIRDVITALLATTVFSFNAWFIRWAGTGMETSLAVLLVLLTFWYCIRNEYVLATVFATLLTLVRPESFILIGLIVLDLFINSHNKRRAVKMGIVLLVLYIIFLLPWHIYAYATFGRVFPNTAMAKAGLNFDLSDILYTIADAGGTIALTDGIAAVILLLFGLRFFLKKRNDLKSEEEEAERFFVFRNVFISAAWIAGIILFYSLTGVNVVSRYLLIIIPPMIIAAFLLMSRVLSQGVSQRIRLIVMVGFTLAFSAQNIVAYHSIVLPRAEAFERGIMEFCFIPMGKWLGANAPEGSVVVAPDIGAIGYYSQRKIFDTAGLISPEVIPLLHRGYSPYQIIEKQLYRGYCAADYVVHNSERASSLANAELEAVMARMVGSLRVFETEPTYYTLYKTHFEEKQH